MLFRDSINGTLYYEYFFNVVYKIVHILYKIVH
nr:MAG TPA: hypothetical protein [Microviridae sp.]